jgi:DNA-binding SARP family transcriptional activator/Tfp pilus assembly protein PilF
MLGSLDVVADGRPVDLTAGRLRALLAVLAMSAGRAVSLDRIALALWGSRPPAAIRGGVHTYVTRLRAVLGTSAISSQPTGYVLHARAEQVDVLRFTELLDAAPRNTDPVTEQVLLDEALALWRGAPFGGVPSDWLVRTETPRLVERRLAAVERCVDLWLILGAGSSRAAELVAQLRQLTTLHPLRETLWVRLLTLLQHCGRSAEALEQYAMFRASLADELGTDPGPELQHLYAQLLTGRTPTTASAGRTEEPAAPARQTLPEVVPRQLPAAPQMFTGRSRELAILDESRAASTVAVSVIDGMAGTGKTALAVHAAHRLADRYPGGQLFIDLHGHTPGMRPVEPAVALEHMLRALGVSGTHVPSTTEERATLFRTRLADRQALILLDNAATEDQVLPLLPGAPGCLVLITSRRRLSGLDHTRTLSLGPLPVPDAVRMFVQDLGDDRLSDRAEDLLTELVELCGRLPLAIRIATGRLRSHPAWSLSHLAERLRDQHHRLGELEAGTRSMTTALDVSYRHLRPDQQRAYLLLGQHPGSDIDAYAAAALLDATVVDAGRTLEQLLDAHLLLEPTAGRYKLHDLIRTHAAHLARGCPGDPGETAGLTRLLDHYRHTASLATEVAYPFEREYRPRIPAPPTPTPRLPGPTAALDWLDDELPNLLAVAGYAAEHGRYAHVLHLSTVLHRHLRSRGRYHDAGTLHRQALSTARAVGDQAGEVDARNGIGHIHRLLDQHRPATQHFEKALGLARAIGHGPGELDARTGLGHIHWMQGLYPQAIQHFAEALRLARATGDCSGELDALIGLGHVSWMQGRHSQAAQHFEEALRLARAAGHHRGELNALGGLAHSHQVQGRYAEAGDTFGQAVRMARTLGHRLGELQGLAGLGGAERLLGRYEQAEDHYRRVLELAREVGDRNFEFEARQGLGRLRHVTGDSTAALMHHNEALTLAGQLSQPVDQARAHDGIAHAHHARNEHEPAQDHWRRALDILLGLAIDHTDDEETTVAALRAHLTGSIESPGARK